MSKAVRQRQPDQAPTQGDLDELMEDPPASVGDGVLSAHQDGGRIRRRVYGGTVLGALVLIAIGYSYVAQLQHKRDNPTAQYTVAAGAEDEIRPRSMVWNSGFARLALSREPPGITQIVLPDRFVELADGVDTAQFKVNVVDGRTISFKVLTGQVRVIER